MILPSILIIEPITELILTIDLDPVRWKLCAHLGFGNSVNAERSWSQDFLDCMIEGQAPLLLLLLNDELHIEAISTMENSISEHSVTSEVTSCLNDDGQYSATAMHRQIIESTLKPISTGSSHCTLHAQDASIIGSGHPSPSLKQRTSMVERKLENQPSIGK